MWGGNRAEAGGRAKAGGRVQEWELAFRTQGKVSGAHGGRAGELGEGPCRGRGLCEAAAGRNARHEY